MNHQRDLAKHFFCKRGVGEELRQFHHPIGHRLTYATLRPGAVTDPLALPVLLSLTENLLHIAQAHSEHRCQCPEAPVTVRMRLENLQTQIILIGSCHLMCVAEFRLCDITPSLLLL